MWGNVHSRNRDFPKKTPPHPPRFILGMPHILKGKKKGKMTRCILKNEMPISKRVLFSEMSCEIFHFIMTCKCNRIFYLVLYVICKVLETKGIRYGMAKRPCLY
jgi:hypothetical protein